MFFLKTPLVCNVCRDTRWCHVVVAWGNNGGGGAQLTRPTPLLLATDFLATRKSMPARPGPGSIPLLRPQWLDQRCLCGQSGFNQNYSLGLMHRGRKGGLGGCFTPRTIKLGLPHGRREPVGKDKQRWKTDGDLTVSESLPLFLQSDDLVPEPFQLLSQ